MTGGTLDVVAGHVEAMRRAYGELESARTIDEVKDIRDRAEAARQYAKAAGYSRDITNMCAEIKIRAERKAGTLLAEMPKSKGAAQTRSQDVTALPPKLEDIGVSKMQSSRWQQAAAIPDEVVDSYIEDVRESGDDVTSLGLRLFAARCRQPAPVTEPVPLPDGVFSCLVIDPPWPIQKAVKAVRPDQGISLDYPALDVRCQKPQPCNDDGDVTTCWERSSYQAQEDYEESPEPLCQSIECVAGHALSETAAEDCHLYLWVTHKHLPDGLQLLAGWGFAYQCVMTWRKPVGVSPFSWMYDTEHVLFAHRGNLPLSRLGLRLSFDAPVTGHSVKPDVFYDRVAEASPGPRLDMFARRERDGFTAWGNEVS